MRPAPALCGSNSQKWRYILKLPKANVDLAPVRKRCVSNLIPQLPCSFVQVLDAKDTLLSDPTFFQDCAVMDQVIHHLFQLFFLRFESVWLRRLAVFLPELTSGGDNAQPREVRIWPAERLGQKSRRLVDMLCEHRSEFAPLR